jgi:signal transduction histidine kinase
MYKPKLIILAWLLLLVPTLLLGVGAMRLLQSEEARLASSNRAAAADRVEAIAGNIDLAIAEVQDGLQGTLQQLPQQNLSGPLYNWKRDNPLVRNVFIWQRGRGLLLPNPERPASDEEAAFVRRYLPLFADQSSWREPKPDLQVQAEPGAAPARVILAERRELRQLAKQVPVAELADSSSSSAAIPAEPATAADTINGTGNWRSWYADDQLHLLGWFEPENNNQRYGVELEMMALLSRLLGNLPQQPGGQESYALLDGNGRIFHQVGNFEILPELEPLASVAILNLPHWQVAAYADPSANVTGSGIKLIGSLLIGTFIVAILLGGSLLLWQAYRNQRDAGQKTTFVSNVSHELKTPLTTIRMYAELLGEGKISDTSKQQRYLQTIIKESQRLTRLVNNVLDFSRLEQGRRRFQLEEIDLGAFLEELIEAQQPRLADAGMVLTTELSKDPGQLLTDRDALEQIILNLIDNGIKYAAEGKRLQLQVTLADKRYCFRLRDWGPGIPAAHKQRVFDKFHRIDNTLTSRQQGSGLGLSIARQLAEGLGGRLNYCPAEGGGCCFELILPVTGEK